MGARVAVWVQYAGMALAVSGGAPWPRPAWAVVAAGLAVLGVGIALKRRADRGAGADTSAAHAEGTHAPREGSVAAASAALPRMLEAVRALARDAREGDLAAVAARVEEVQQDGTERVAAAQDALTRAYGFQRYAEVMAPLAAAERWLYRAWSAASDGHRAEAVASIEGALPHLEQAASALASLTAGGGGGAGATRSA